MAVDTPSLTPTQRERRRRILVAALDLAAAGGFDAVQMREVAATADVALGTLYRYFPSKEHLLVAGMGRSIEDLRERLGQKPPRGDTAAERVTDVLGRANRYLFRRPEMTRAMVRALASGDEVGHAVREVTVLMTGIIDDAIVDGRQSGPTPEEDEAARLLNYVWLSSLVSWTSGAQPANQVDADLASAAALLLRS